MAAYYNEWDEYAAQWIRNLIVAGLIAPGDVDTRSISDVRPDDLRGYSQCHFFAGIGGWSAALRLAGWPDDRRVWTASCPCQPFSDAGKGAGFTDERHLWPHFDYLAGILQPKTIFGEQVASKDALEWVDLVQTDLEAKGYAFAAVDTCAAGFGAPHIRQRLYWMAYAEHYGRDRPQGATTLPDSHGAYVRVPDGDCASSRMDDPDDEGLERLGSGYQAEGGRVGAIRPVTEASELSRLAYPSCQRQRANQSRPDSGVRFKLEGAESRGDSIDHSPDAQIGGVSRPTNGFWADADWLLCRDGKWRPVEPGTFPLAHGVPGRVGRLRAYGNAIVPPQAAEIIKSFMEYRP